MGAKTLAQFSADLKFELGGRTDLDAYYTDWFNTAYNDLCTRDKFWGLKIPSRYMFPELNTSAVITTAASQTSYSWPTDMAVLFSIHDDTNGIKLSRIEMRDYLRRVGTGGTTAAPTKYARHNLLFFWPTPDAAYQETIYYRKRPSPLVNTTDITILGSEWDNVILKLAVIQSMLRMKEYENAEIEKKEWLEVLGSKINLYTWENKDKRDFMVLDLPYHYWKYR